MVPILNFRFVHVIRLEAAPKVLQTLEKLASPGADLVAKVEETMATVRDVLNALRTATEQVETLRADNERLTGLMATMERTENEEDRVDAETHATYEEQIRQLEERRAADLARIAELEAQPDLSQDDTREFEEIMARLNPPDPNDTGPTPGEETDPDAGPTQ